MEPRHLICAAIAVSVVGHLALAAGVFFADARPIEYAAIDNVAVDLVTPQQLAEAENKATETPPEQKPEPEKPEFRLPDLTIKPTFEEQKTPAASAAKPPSQAQSARQQLQAAPPPQQQSAAQQAQQQVAPVQSPPPSSAAQPPAQQQAALQPSQPQAPPANNAPPANQAPSSSEAPPADPVPPQPDPDITVKYGVILGLPGFGGGPATEQADIPKSDIAAFRNHLRSCLKRPANIALTDDVMVKLRTTLSRDGRLTAEPAVLEVRRPAKAALLLQAAKQALEACQPYSMLPADKYDEWKVLDLPFTPQDFAG